MNTFLIRHFSRFRPLFRDIVRTAVPPPIDPVVYTRQLLQNMAASPSIYAVIHLYSFRFHVTKGDLIVCHRIKNVRLGDILKLDRVVELGSKDCTLKGRPWISPDYYSIEACVTEHGKGERRRCKLPYKRKGIRRARFFQPLTTTLRIRKMDINANCEQKLEN